MKLRYVVWMVAFVFLTTLVNAQQVVGVARGKAKPPRINEQSGKAGSQIVGAAPLPTDHLGQKQPYNLEIKTSSPDKQAFYDNLSKAVLNPNPRPSFFVDGYVQDMCKKVAGCMQWAKAEFAKDNSFYISVFQPEHDCTVVVNGKKVVKHQYAKFMHTSDGSPQRIKTFTQSNVPVNSSRCIDCGNVSADCQTFASVR